MTLGRVNTGPMTVGEDWQGVFIRGDDALGWSASLEMWMESFAEEGIRRGFSLVPLVDLLNALKSAKETR